MLSRISLGGYTPTRTYFFLPCLFIILGCYNRFSISNRSSGNLEKWQTTFAGKGYVSYLTNCIQKWQTSMHFNSSSDYFYKIKFPYTSFWAFRNVTFSSFIWHTKWSLNNCILCLIHSTAQRYQYWGGGKCIYRWLHRIYFHIRLFGFFFSFWNRCVCLFLGAQAVCVDPLCWVPCRGAFMKN